MTALPLSLSIPSLHAYLNHQTMFNDQLVVDAIRELIALTGQEANTRFRNHLQEIVHDILTIGHTLKDYDELNPHNLGFQTQEDLMETLRQVQVKWTGQIDMEWDEETVYFRVHQANEDEKVESVLFAQFVHGTNVANAEFDEELFMAGLLQAASQHGNPLGVLRVLADHGFNTIDRRSPAWQNVVGQE